MAHIKDITGFKSGKLTVIEMAGKNSKGKSMCRCKCSCGGKKTVLGQYITSKRTKSCGCLLAENSYRIAERRRAAREALASSPK